MTHPEQIACWKQLEQEGLFHQDVNPVCYDDCYPVTEAFPYRQTNPIRRFDAAAKRALIVNPFTWFQNRFRRKTKVVGRENLKGIDRAVLVCNHVDIFDCLAVKYAVRHRMKFVAAEFNNRKGFLGSMMRAAGILPLSGKYRVMKRFHAALADYLQKDYYVLFYPEQAMWYQYDKPRPLKNGAFHYAARFNVPVVPLFITYRPSGKKDKEGAELLYFTIHILPPVTAPAQEADRAAFCKEAVSAAWKRVYEQSYQTPLSYGEEGAK